MFTKEHAPGFIQESAICLKAIANRHAGPNELLLKTNDFTKKIQAQERWLTTLPHKFDFAGIEWLTFNVLTNEGFEQILRHSPFCANAVQVLGMQIVAVMTVEITNGPYWFHQNVKRLLMHQDLSPEPSSLVR